MSYVSNNLVGTEKLIYMGRLSLWSFFFLLGACFFLIIHPVITEFHAWIAGIGVFGFLYVYLAYDTTELSITSKRVIVKHGVFRRTTTELYLSKVEGIEVEQGILGRIFNYGTIFVKGVGTEIAPVRNVSDPIQFRKRFFEAADEFQADESDKQENH